MDAVGALSLLLIAVAATAALCGYITATLRERNKRRFGRYFVLGVVTGFVAAAVTRRRIGPGAIGTVTRRLALPQRSGSSLSGAALQVRRSLSRTLP
ncbi:hypothetical protein [Mycolicibacterium sphagni]|uniref:Uncharacterized protein n=1 Tax=Mycolicibacterium sphagni TaxID=1786 RepID=A0A255D981_9MYCO|nr:hypothetical protein [Mycolicibacterium sphagni]OYN75936.1 hypothetical protein CG716_24105 [Mycolicibacterium sphagni]